MPRPSAKASTLSTFSLPRLVRSRFLALALFPWVRRCVHILSPVQSCCPRLGASSPAYVSLSPFTPPPPARGPHRGTRTRRSLTDSRTWGNQHSSHSRLRLLVLSVARRRASTSRAPSPRSGPRRKRQSRTSRATRSSSPEVSPARKATESRPVTSETFVSGLETSVDSLVPDASRIRTLRNCR